GAPWMLPKVVHHKQNGHTHAPSRTLSGGDVIRTIHSGAAPAAAPTTSLLRFASIVSSERAVALLADVTRAVDGVSMALDAALAHTEADIERGGFAEVRAELEALRAHAERPARTGDPLIGAAGRTVGSRSWWTSTRWSPPRSGIRASRASTR